MRVKVFTSFLDRKTEKIFSFTYRKISDLCLQGLSFGQIKAYLESMRIKIVMSNDHWHTITIQKMLKNEKYKGDIMMQKTYTEGFMTDKKGRNIGQRN